MGVVHDETKIEVQPTIRRRPPQRARRLRGKRGVQDRRLLEIRRRFVQPAEAGQDDARVVVKIRRKRRSGDGAARQLQGALALASALEHQNQNRQNRRVAGMCAKQNSGDPLRLRQIARLPQIHGAGQIIHQSHATLPSRASIRRNGALT